MLTAEEIIERLRHYGHEAYIVGGAVRDKILGLKPKDKDVVTSALPSHVENIFSDRTYKSFGKNFLVSFVDNVEISTYRSDRYHGLNDKNVEIKPAKTVKEDVMRRDFTINGLIYDPETDQVIDYIDGTKDIENRIIRFIGDPEHRIWEDPNRIIRACRFLAKIDGDFDKQTFENLSNYSNFIGELVDNERIRLEILKAMEIKKASRFFYALHDINGLQYIFPSLDKCYGITGGPYHLEEVFDHCMMSGDSVSTRKPLLKLTGYLHDIGKGISIGINPRTDDVWFKDHECTGADAAQEELKELRFSNDEIHYVSSLIRLHMRISHSRLSPRAVRRTLRMLEEYKISYQDLIRVSVSDRRGNLRNSQYYTLYDVKELYECFLNEVNRKPVTKYSDLEVNGNDIMETLGIGPGKIIGTILNFLMEKVTNEPELNDKNSLISIIEEHFRQSTV